MEMQQEQIQCQETCTRLAVLEVRVDALARAGEHREDRILAVEHTLDNLSEAFEQFRVAVERRLTEVQLSSWRQFWALAAVVVASAVGMAVWLSQQLLAHIVK